MIQLWCLSRGLCLHRPHAFRSVKTQTLVMLLTCLTVSCTQKPNSPDNIDFSKLPYKTLSEYGFFKEEMQPNDGLLAYEPISPLFSDYAFKKRFVYMPKGVSATADVSKPNEAFDFPDKTILIKTFYYPEDFSKPEGKKRLVETRLLVKIKAKWEAYTYKWNEAQSEAEYKSTGGQIPVSWKDEAGHLHNINYTMPNKNQCKSCHSQNGKFTPIGPKLKQLNFAKNTENQLDTWVKMGFLKGGFDKSKIQNLASMNDPKASLDIKARSYLDVNCGHCHSTTGPAASSGLRLNIEENDPYHWGVKKSPVAAGIGAGEFLYDIYPKHAKESIIIYRMNSTNPGIMMPEIGRVTIHKEGVELIRKWIDGLEE